MGPSFVGVIRSTKGVQTVHEYKTIRQELVKAQTRIETPNFKVCALQETYSINGRPSWGLYTSRRNGISSTSKFFEEFCLESLMTSFVVPRRGGRGRNLTIEALGRQPCQS